MAGECRNKQEMLLAWETAHLCDSEVTTENVGGECGILGVGCANQ